MNCIRTRDDTVIHEADIRAMVRDCIWCMNDDENGILNAAFSDIVHESFTTFTAVRPDDWTHARVMVSRIVAWHSNASIDCPMERDECFTDTRVSSGHNVWGVL